MRLANHWYDNNDFDPTSDAVSVMFYDQILKELKNRDVRNAVLTRKICSSLFSGTTFAENLYSRYINDCSDNELKNTAARYYADYMDLKNAPGEKIRIDLTGTLIYLDQEESSEILNFLKAEGIPHYVLIIKDGVIVEKKAPGPDSGAIIEKIDHLLEL